MQIVLLLLVCMLCIKCAVSFLPELHAQICSCLQTGNAVGTIQHECANFSAQHTLKTRPNIIQCWPSFNVLYNVAEVWILGLILVL